MLSRSGLDLADDRASDGVGCVTASGKSPPGRRFSAFRARAGARKSPGFGLRIERLTPH
jgi:hypothetical protein